MSGEGGFENLSPSEIGGDLGDYLRRQVLIDNGVPGELLDDLARSRAAYDAATERMEEVLGTPHTALDADIPELP